MGLGGVVAVRIVSVPLRAGAIAPCEEQREDDDRYDDQQHQARRPEDQVCLARGDVTGRVDDVINVSGHRIGSAEIEDALAAEHAIVESAAIGIPHDLKGQGIVVYAVARDPSHPDLEMLAVRAIAAKVGRYAVPEKVYIVPDLPKTRPGKNVRRLTRKIACGETDGLGDLSTLADPEIVEVLIAIVQG